MFTAEQRAFAQDVICKELAKGKSLRQICSERHKPGEFPHIETVRRWLRDDDEFRVQYAHAHEDQADFYAEQIIEIADQPAADFTDDGDGKVAAAASRAEMERRKLMIDARKWVASKLKPKVYGDRLNVDGDIGLSISDEQLESKLAFLIGKATALAASGGEGAPEETA